MPRRARIQKRTILPDPIYGNPGLAKFINCVMLAGKKSTAEKIVYESFEKIRRSQRREPLDVFEQAMRNVTPVLEVKPKRVGGGASIKRKEDTHKMAESNKAFSHFRY